MKVDQTFNTHAGKQVREAISIMSYFIKSQQCFNTGLVFKATPKHSQTDNVNTILLAWHLKGTENHLPNCADVIRHVQLSVARQEMVQLFFSTLSIHAINTKTQLFMALYSFEEEKQTFFQAGLPHLQSCIYSTFIGMQGTKGKWVLCRYVGSNYIVCYYIPLLNSLITGQRIIKEHNCLNVVKWCAKMTYDYLTDYSPEKKERNEVLMCFKCIFNMQLKCSMDYAWHESSCGTCSTRCNKLWFWDLSQAQMSREQCDTEWYRKRNGSLVRKRSPWAFYYIT